MRAISPTVEMSRAARRAIVCSFPLFVPSQPIQERRSFMFNLKQIGVAAVLALAAASASAVNVASGKLWHVPEAVTFNAIPANVPLVTPDVTFDVNSPFNFNGSSVTVGTWLASSGAFNIVENTAGTLTSPMDDGVFGTMLEFTGVVTVTTGMQFTVTHDDGLTLIIGGIDLGFNPGPTAPVVNVATYNGPSGTFAFQLVYAECCGGPAVLQVDLPFQSTPAVPEPGTYALMGLGLAGMGFALRGRRERKGA